MPLPPARRLSTLAVCLYALVSVPAHGCHAATQQEPTPRNVPAGVWGGAHLRLEVTAGGAVLEYDCATGAIPEPLRLDERGRFENAGVYQPERGGPVRDGDEPVRRPARHSGRVEGDAMTLSVVLTDSSESVGTFRLVRGNEGDVVKCR